MKSVSGKELARVVERHGWKLLRVTYQELTGKLAQV